MIQKSRTQLIDVNLITLLVKNKMKIHFAKKKSILIEYTHEHPVKQKNECLFIYKIYRHFIYFSIIVNHHSPNKNLYSVGIVL